MATISNIQDISRALRDNPEWREEIRRTLLSAELLALPETHAALTARVDALTVGLDALTVEVRALTVKVNALTTEMRALTARMDDLTARVDALTTEVRAFVVATNHRLDTMEERQARMERRLDQLWGDGLEAKLPNRLRTLVIREFDVRRLRSIWAASRTGIFRGSAQFEDDVDTAADTGKITKNEENRLMATDLVMRARRNSDDSTIWFAAEASGVINRDDIERARQSADAITKMYDQDAIPIVYGYRISDHQRRQASEHDVHVFTDPDGD